MRSLLLKTSSAVVLLGLSGALALARTYDDSHLPYSDAPSDRPTAVAISLLTDMGILQGDPGGTIRPNDHLNRAEFMKIVMGLYGDQSSGMPAEPCFPDVPKDAWYASPVCRAKSFGIVQGNEVDGVPPPLWRFEPVRNVQYEEAVKVLVKLYALPINNVRPGGQWYEPYLQAAAEHDLDLSTLVPGDRITRGEMARLVASFVAYIEGELADLRAAQSGIVRSSSTSSRSSATGSSLSSRSSSSRSSVSSTSSRSSGSSQSSTGSDALRVESNFLLLGQISSPLAGVRFFSNNEPVNVTRVTITLENQADSVDAILVFDETQKLLGSAAREAENPTRYTLNVASQALTLPYRQPLSLYVQARLRSFTNGGQSGQDVQVDSVSLEGDGEWSSNTLITSSTDTFPAFETARGAITAIERVSPLNGVLVTGSNQLLTEFRFTAQETDTLAHVRLLSVRFSIESSGDVNLSNMRVRTEGSDESSSCSVAGSTVTCSSLSAAYGSLESPRTLRVYGDISFAPGAEDPFLRLTINNPGSTSAGGDVTWTDGDETFDWVPFAQPVVRGTLLQ